MRRLCAVLLVLVLLALVCLGATERLRNDSGKLASGVTITLSEKVRITSYDASVFSKQEPTVRAETFTFSGGLLADREAFSLAWTPSDATVTNCTWLADPTLSGPLEATVETTEYELAGDPATSGALQGKVVRAIERGILPLPGDLRRESGDRARGSDGLVGHRHLH